VFILKFRTYRIWALLCIFVSLSGCFWGSRYYQVSGYVTDHAGRGIPNVTIVYKGNISDKTQTSADGSFQIDKLKGLTVNSRIELAFFLTVFWAVLTRGKRAILTLF
jgi:hypothetical protein